MPDVFPSSVHQGLLHDRVEQTEVEGAYWFGLAVVRSLSINASFKVAITCTYMLRIFAIQTSYGSNKYFWTGFRKKPYSLSMLAFIANSVFFQDRVQKYLYK